MTADPDLAPLPPLLKDLNERTVLETLRADAPISRAEISRRAGISKPTVSLALQSLVDGGPRARVRAPIPAGPSFGAVFFEPIPDAALVLGLDLGARFARGAVCDLRGACASARTWSSPAPSAESALAAIASRHRVADRGGRLLARADRRARSSACPASSTPTADST